MTTPISTVYNGIEVDKFATGNGSRIRAELGLGKDEFVAVYTGRAELEKNLPAVINAARLCPDMKFVIVGDGSLLEELKLSAAGLPVIFTGSRPYDEISDYLHAADVYVTASLTEVNPLTVAEAQAAGLPVVGIDADGVNEIVIHGKTGLLGTADELASNLKQVRDKHLKESMAAAAIENAQRFSVDAHVDSLLKVYELMRKEY